MNLDGKAKPSKHVEIQEILREKMIELDDTILRYIDLIEIKMYDEEAKRKENETDGLATYKTKQACQTGEPKKFIQKKDIT